MHYEASGKITIKTIYKYDAKGNMVEDVYYESKTAFGKTRFVLTSEETWEFTYWN